MDLIGNVIVGTIIYAGVTAGIERAVTIMMPLMFSLLVGLSVYNYFAGGFIETLQWLFTPDFSKVTGATFLAAVGQAFFSIGVGMGGMMTYGAYLPKDFSIARGAGTMCWRIPLSRYWPVSLSSPRSSISVSTWQRSGADFPDFAGGIFANAGGAVFARAVLCDAGGGWCDVDGGSVGERDQLDQGETRYHPATQHDLWWVQ